jgi:hypothetical protein
MCCNTKLLTYTSSFPLTIALNCIEAEGLQAPSLHELEVIIRNGLLATKLLTDACVLRPETSDLEEFFRDFVLRCNNRAPGVGDAATH